MRPALLKVLTALPVLAASVGLWVLAGGAQSPSEPRVTRGAHATVTPPGELGRYLNATQAASSDASAAAMIAEGRRLFRSNSLALDGESCQACHTDGGANNRLGTITHPQAPGDFVGPRDPPALWGVARTAPYGWDGSTATLEAMVIDTVKSHFKSSVTLDNDPAAVAALAAPLLAYLEQLEPPTSAFDDGTLTAQQLRGERLFQGKASCIACHTGVLFTDNLVQTTGVRQVPGANDPGAPPPPLPPGAEPTDGPFINTPQLRDVRHSAPYMHNGVERTLRDVVEFYNSRSLVSPLHLSTAEIDDLIAFLRGL